MGTTKRKLEDIIQYILTWLCYGDEEAAARVAYTADEKALEDHDVIIVPNGKLGNSIVLPDMGNVVVEQPAKGKAIIRTDIVYNTFFFISRAEETFNTERDEHDRFIARFSILGHSNRMQMPILDEHARLLLKLLNCPLPSPGFEHIYLTHDIDTIAQYRSVRGAIGGIKRGETQQVWASLRDIHNDPLYTFPWLIDQDASVSGAETIYFVKHTKGRGYDYPQYRLQGRDYKRLKKLLRNSGAFLGVHGSYYGYIPKIKYSKMYRAHYLRESMRQMQALINAGYTDDFTMGFADEAGFRLQTTRAVRWINPMTMKLTNLTLHPLIVMDTTLSNENYMNLTEDEAYFLCERLIAKVKMHHGDLCLLWHNNNLTENSYHKSLYTKVLNLLK
ncbi:MAG: hypothetical protein II452_03620 [Paludibacteraceae bacterium]|nr:hypothetical protein [Paludibacteraceae bacterium]MBQ5378828.1 hypothetical protein [Paludibacteraceae bacterium]